MSCADCQYPKPHWPFPWPEPRRSTGLYDMPDTGPPEMVEFEHGEHRFRVTPTNEVGCDSGRRRYRSECITCGMVLHRASTSAYTWIRYHLAPKEQGR